jgi:prophage regulatory protein
MTKYPNPVIPIAGERLLRLREVEHRIGLKKTGIYTAIRESGFPKPRQLGLHKSVGWLESEVTKWIVDRPVSQPKPGAEPPRKLPRRRRP